VDGWLRTGVTTADLPDLVAGELKEPAAPRAVHFVAGLPMTTKDKIGKQAFRARLLGRGRSSAPGVWHAPR